MGITSLYHKVFYHPVKELIVVKAFLYQLDHVVPVSRSFIIETYQHISRGSFNPDHAAGLPALGLQLKGGQKEDDAGNNQSR